MSRVLVIGGSGHVGTYLLPALVERGHDVINLSRGQAKRYRHNAAWNAIEQVVVDRTVEENAGTFGSTVAALRPDVVVDMISFKPSSTQSLVEALSGKVEHFLHCSTIWVFGHNAAVPAGEDDPLNPFGEYGINKAAIETWLLHEARQTGFPATIFRPGHIVGPGWAPINPVGHLNTEVFSCIARNEEVTLPNFGLETLHHVHADDVVQMILLAIDNRSASLGEAFNAVSPKVLNLRGYAEAMFRWFGLRAKAALRAFRKLEGPTLARGRTTGLGAHLPQLVHVHRQGTSPPRLRATLLKFGCITGGGFRFNRCRQGSGTQRLASSDGPRSKAQFIRVNLVRWVLPPQTVSGKKKQDGESVRKWVLLTVEGWDTSPFKKDGKVVDWMEHVSDEQYQAGRR